MCDVKSEKSDSDVSSSSWTLLDDETEKVKSQDHGFEDLTPEPDKTAPVEPMEVKPVPKENSFLSLDEFLQERMIEHDYDYEDKMLLNKVKKHKKKKGSKMKKAPIWGISVFLGIMLTLTAVTTLCSHLSQNQSIKRGEEENFPVQKQQLKTKQAYKKADLLQEIDRTIKEIERLHSHKTISTSKNYSSTECNKSFGPQLLNMTSSKPPLKPESEMENKNILDLTKGSRIFKPKMRTARTKWTVLKEVLLDTNVHALVSLIMTNVYLFTLLTDLSRRHNNDKCSEQLLSLEDLSKIDNPEELRKYLFRELPFHGVKIPRRTKCKCRCRKLKPKKKPVNSTLTVANYHINNESSGDNISCKPYNYNCCPLLRNVEQPPLALPSTSLELGKSECEKRFQELDECQRKFDNLKQMQRDRIKLLKQKYRNEVSYIRDTEEESEARAEKINRTSKRFIKKLKFNREKYLVELRKVRELRRKVEKKDASTGSYAVAIPSVYYFGGSR